MLTHSRRLGYNRAMPRFTVIDGTPSPDSPTERIRTKYRASRMDGIPQCPRCGGREYVVAKIGKASNKLCVLCLTRGERIVMV